MKRSTLIVAFLLSCAGLHGSTAQDVPQGLSKINHIIVLYQENWAFDGLYGSFPGAEGIANATYDQVDAKGDPITVLPQPNLGKDPKTHRVIPDTRFPADMPVKPYDLLNYIKTTDKTGDMVHRFYQEQAQIDGGKMDKFVSVSDNGGLVMSYFDASQLPEGKLAAQYTLCDHYFQGAFGGSLLNHLYLITADTISWKDAPATVRAQVDAQGHMVKDGFVSPDGYIINNCQTVDLPHDPTVPKDQLVPGSDVPTIGDRLSDKGISWAWYAEGFNEAVSMTLAGKKVDDYEYHHQPFIYFSKYAGPDWVDHKHLKDKADFLDDLQKGQLPSVCWIKALGENDEHPGYSDIQKGQQYVMSLVKAIQDSPYWKDTAILITYDDHGGRWDHVAPFKRDWLGPGIRLPLIVVSPFAKKGFVDKTTYDTTSILKFIESRWDLTPLNDRDKNAVDLLNAFDLAENPQGSATKTTP